MLNAERINFELQVKSMVHDFWSEIEHEVVYKNPEYVVNDQFYRQMLGAIRENLDVVDKQLEIMYTEISYESQNTRIGMDEKSFKVFISSSVNELVNAKMKGSLGFATDFKKCSATIAHYIYLNDFINNRADPGQKLLDYIQMLDYYNDVQIDFTNELDLGGSYESSDPFCDILGKYLASQINTNFIWHVFFVILLQLGQGTNMEDFDSFVHFIRTLLIQPGWFAARFAGYPEPQKTNLKKKLVEILAEALIEIGGIEIVYEDRLLTIMKEFRSFVEKVEKDNPEYADLKKVMRRMEKGLYHNITILFR
ncbi:MAG: hypothetical protein IKD69_01485, partial [Solobacterium sp.]|nr:hypothetical protein [Solobacterium sp.]